MKLISDILKYFHLNTHCLNNKEKAGVSIIIPTYNDPASLMQLLVSIKKQKDIGYIEIIIVDSSGTNGSMRLAKKIASKFIKIRKKHFSHDMARNLGAKYAKYEYLLFLTQDVLLPSDFWISKTIGAMSRLKAVAASCEEIPRKDSDLFAKIGLWNHNRFMNLSGKNRVMVMPGKKNYESLRMNSQLSNVACMIRKDVFNKYKFAGAFAEDVDLGMRLIRDGHRLALLSSVKVIHSHKRSAIKHLQRGYTDTIFMKRIFHAFPLTKITTSKDLFMDIILTYQAVLALIEREMQNIKIPCSSKELSTTTVRMFRPLRRARYPTNPPIKEEVSFDRDFTALIRVIRNCIATKELIKPFNRGFVSAILDYLNVSTRRYLDKHARIIDNEIFEDYKYNIIKYFAFRIGASLAACKIKKKTDHSRTWKYINKLLKS